MHIRWKVDAEVRKMSILECNKQKASPKYQHPSTERIMLKGITITPSNRSARARDITSMLVGVCSCLKCAMEMMTTEFPRTVTDIANTSKTRATINLSCHKQQSRFEALVKGQEKDRKMVQILLRKTKPPVVATVPHGKISPQDNSKTFVEPLRGPQRTISGTRRARQFSGVPCLPRRLSWLGAEESHPPAGQPDP
ncbi:hypothetical protein AOLI_G00040470 [Acnodon oligacanthus]